MDRCLFYLAVICLNPRMYSPDVLNQTVKGSISNSGILHLTMYSNNSIGVILHCVDSEGSQIGMYFIPQSSNKRSIALTFNHAYREVSLEQFCGCDPCFRSKLEFGISFEKSLINATCNKRQTEKIASVPATNARYPEGSKHKVLPVPLSITNGRQRMYIMVGNIGPYVGAGNITNNPEKDQIEMCVDSFLYNSKSISLRGEGGKVRSPCPWRCNGTICNGGICNETVYGPLTCDCHATALNGLYCNRSLRAYGQREDHSYETVEGINNLYIKMTWRTLYHQPYCLIEMVHRLGRMTISMRDDRIWVDSSALSHYSIDGISFISVTFTYDRLLVKFGGNEYNQSFDIRDLRGINIGFTVGRHSCRSFDGTFDLHYDSSELSSNQSIRTKQDRTTGTGSTLKITNSQDQRHGTGGTSNTTRTSETHWMYVGPIIGGLLLSIFVLAITLYWKSTKLLKEQMQLLTTNYKLQLDHTIPTFTETGDYCLVQDYSDYEIVQDAYEHISDDL